MKTKEVTLTNGRRITISAQKQAMLGSEIQALGQKTIEEKIRAAERESRELAEGVHLKT